MPAKKELKEFEYVNTTKTVKVWINKEYEYEEKPIPICVFPGKSVMLTESDIKRNRRESKEIFAEGLLRPVGATKDQLSDIEVRNDMSDIELREFVKRADSITAFASKLRKITSKITLEDLLQHVIKQNKTVNYFQAVQKRMDKLTKEQEELIEA